MNTLELYEKKIVKTAEFPAEDQTHLLQDPGWYFALHWHEHVEFHYILGGSGYFLLGQQRHEVRKGTLIIANSNELHRGFCETVPYVDHVLIFCLDAFSKELDEQNLVFQNAIYDDQQVQYYMDAIWEERQQKKRGYETACKALLTQMMVYLSRNYVVQTLTKEETSRKRQELERLHTVVSYIEKHYTEPISNQELADLLYLSKGRFEHLFQDSIGISPLQYINELRLKKAMSHIKGGVGSLTEIAAAVGFGDYNHFGRLFRRYYGCTPRQAQQRFKRAESYE